MSIKAMSWVWELQIEPTTKFVLLALSDHANDVDFTCWPSLTHLQNKTGYSRPTVYKTIDKLVEIGAMVRVGLHSSGATLYRVQVGNDITLGKELTQVKTLPKLGNVGDKVGNVGDKLGKDVTPNHKNHHEPSLTIKARFQKPTPREVNDYCFERRNAVGAEQRGVVDSGAFLSFYESNGWKVGKNPMKDWRAAVRTWEQRNKSNAGDYYAPHKDTRSRAKRVSDRLDDIARTDAAKHGIPDNVG